ncbi:MAG: glycosyltransferase family 4 protein [Roseburia sp.]|nr:glycosyltransferase family 4 protein [Roseburia sp.]
MVLVIDCFKLVRGAGKSIGIYNLALNLVRNLVKERERTQDERIKECQIIVLGNAYNEQEFTIPGVEFICIHHNPRNKIRCIWWELFEVSVIAHKYKADKILYPRGYAPIFKCAKEYIVVHDMIPFYYNEHYKGYFNGLENLYIMWRLKASIRTCDKVITISEASRKDILNRVDVSSDKIEMIHNGYNRVDELSTGVKKKDYIIAVTSKLPHKNAEGIIRAYETYYGKTEKPLKLYIIGIDNVDEYHLKEDVKAYVQCYKYIESNEEMHRMIAEARVFLFLSLIEGFGFPPIEAMQLGTPVICSSISSLPEVVGNAAILVDPDNAVQVADAIVQLQHNQGRIEELTAKGYQNIKRFSWDITAVKYADLIMK